MFLLFDIGGSNTRIAISHDGHTYKEPVVFPTPASGNEGAEAIIAHVRTLLEDTPLFTGVCGCFAGNLEEGIVRHASHLPGWVGINLIEALTPLCVAGNTPHIYNDAQLVGLGEAVSGAGRGEAVVAYLTVSTGVGGARIVRGMFHSDDPAYTHGFEPGFALIPTMRDTPTIVEDELGGAHLETILGTPPYTIDNESFWDAREMHLAHLLHNTIAYWMPTIIVLGGSMITGTHRCISLEGTEYRLRNLEAKLGVEGFPLPAIKKAALGSFGGLHGALALLRMIYP